MKKLIAIAVVFALFTGAAFADVMVGGQVATKAVLIGGDNVEDSDIYAGMSNVAARANAAFTNDTGTAGGLVRLYGMTAKGWWQDWNGGGAPFAFSWWKPIDQLRIQLGLNPDGDWGAAQITGWGFNAEAQDFVAIDQDSGDMGGSPIWRSRNQGFYGGFSVLGATVSIYPADGLTFNIGIPFGNGDRKNGDFLARDVYLKSHINVVYAIPDIGTVRVSFQGAGGKDEDNNQYRSVGNIYGSFYLTAIDGINVDLGVGFGLPFEKNAAGDKTNPGLGVGLGLRYVGDGFGIKFRAGAALAGKTENAGVEAKSATEIGVVILPYFDLEIMRVYLNAGFGVSIFDENDKHTGGYDKDPAVDFFVNPYISKSAGGLTFYAGFRLASPAPTWDGTAHEYNDRLVKWSVPIGFNSYF